MMSPSFFFQKREVDEQSVTPSNAFLGYEGIGKDGILTTPFSATEEFLEVYGNLFLNK